MPNKRFFRCQRTLDSDLRAEVALVGPDDESRSTSGPDEEENSSSSSNSDYQSFSDSDEETDEPHKDTKAELDSREHERQLVLEAAGLVVKRDAEPPARVRRPAPLAPTRPSTVSTTPSSKDLPPLPSPSPVDKLDDAYERYETFKATHGDLNLKRLSSILPSDSPQSPPHTPVHPLTPSASRDSENRGYSNFFHFLGRSRTPTLDVDRRPALVISGPILNPNDLPVRESSPAFGSVGLSSNQRHASLNVF